MTTSNTGQPRGSGFLYAVAGIALLVVGGMVLEDAYGGDGLVFLGFLCIGSGLVGIIAGGVALGTHRSD